MEGREEKGWRGREEDREGKRMVPHLSHPGCTSAVCHQWQWQQ